MQDYIQTLLENFRLVNPMMEMSSAYSDERVHRNIWVENPTGYNNKYFKYGDNEAYSKETKNCRISLTSPNFLYHRNKRNVMDWNLTEADKRQLIGILTSPSDTHPEITVWQEILYVYNNDNFGMRYQVFVSDDWSDDNYPDAFRIDYPMPNYYSLEFDRKKAKNKIAKV